jgi:hypothetical protein
LLRQKNKLDSLRAHLDELDMTLGDQAIATLQRERDHLTTLKQAAAVLITSFETEPLVGVGTSFWKELWESARRYSEAHAYPDGAFPVIDRSARCLLCQQTLGLEGAERMSRFDLFVQDETQRRLGEARGRWDIQVKRLIELQTISALIETNLNDIEAEYDDLARETRELLAAYEVARARTVDVLSNPAPLPMSSLSGAGMRARLAAAAKKTEGTAEALASPDVVKKRLGEVIVERKELELALMARSAREVIEHEISRLKSREFLEQVKNDAAHGPITRKILELSESTITEVVRDRFTRETDRLNIEKVTITKTRGDRGVLMHQPKLVGAKQTVTLPRVLSEGEQTALGLAAFFTEAELDTSKSTLIFDDPISSLDHVRRGKVAARLAELAEDRQIIVFTHDVAFVADLKREADERGVAKAERSIERGRGKDKKPGMCRSDLPWKAKDVPQRLDELRKELARIKRENVDWDSATYEKEIGYWAGSLSETWERIISQEIVGNILSEGGLEVRPMKLKTLVLFTEADDREFQGSYKRVSQWVKRHDKSSMVNYVAPGINELEEELKQVEAWFGRVKKYSKN